MRKFNSKPLHSRASCRAVCCNISTSLPLSFPTPSHLLPLILQSLYGVVVCQSSLLLSLSVIFISLLALSLMGLYPPSLFRLLSSFYIAVNLPLSSSVFTLSPLIYLLFTLPSLSYLPSLLSPSLPSFLFPLYLSPSTTLLSLSQSHISFSQMLSSIIPISPPISLCHLALSLFSLSFYLPLSTPFFLSHLSTLSFVAIFSSLITLLYAPPCNLALPLFPLHSLPSSVSPFFSSVSSSFPSPPPHPTFSPTLRSPSLSFSHSPLHPFLGRYHCLLSFFFIYSLLHFPVSLFPSLSLLSLLSFSFVLLLSISHILFSRPLSSCSTPDLSSFP